jgi:hypothetical protein
MADAQLAALEERAAVAERRVAALEARAAGEHPRAAAAARRAPTPHTYRSPRSAGPSAGGVVDRARYVAELRALREHLVAAKAEQDAAAAEAAKLRYQVLHLKRAVAEADAKLAAAGGGGA